MSYAVISNNLDLVHFLIDNKKQGGLNPAVQDKKGKSSVHFVVNPCNFGSYENVEILLALHSAGYSVNSVDSEGKTPSNYAK